MMPPSGLDELDELPPELLLRSAIELSTKAEMIDCADWALVADVVPEAGVAVVAAAAPDELDVMPARELIKF
jgi:hypothetical protein